VTRLSRVGLWADDSQVPPWEWRQAQRRHQKTDPRALAARNLSIDRLEGIPHVRSTVQTDPHAAHRRAIRLGVCRRLRRYDQDLPKRRAEQGVRAGECGGDHGGGIGAGVHRRRGRGRRERHQEPRYDRRWVPERRGSLYRGERRTDVRGQHRRTEVLLQTEEVTFGCVLPGRLTHSRNICARLPVATPPRAGQCGKYPVQSPLRAPFLERMRIGSIVPFAAVGVARSSFKPAYWT
jgi:hypothetical protein